MASETESEESPLMPTDDVASTYGSEASATSVRLIEEMEQPWPSTYERSISLLASPIINADLANLATKSPKAGGTPLKVTARFRVSEWLGLPYGTTRVTEYNFLFIFSCRLLSLSSDKRRTRSMERKIFKDCQGRKSLVWTFPGLT